VDIRKWIWKGGIMGERVKELRKALGLSGEKFGEKIGVTRSAISDIERGRNGLSDSNIIAICREFNVNEEWLRTGMGEMFKDMSLDEEIISFIGEIQWDTSNTFKKRFISAISKLSEEEWNVLEKIIVDMASNIEENKKD
jgi:Helix-turn-helix.